MEVIEKENTGLKQKCEKQESEYRTLTSQLHKLQNILKRLSPKQVTAQTGTCLMVSLQLFS